jgi:hypothetical protein
MRRVAQTNTRSARAFSSPLSDWHEAGQRRIFDGFPTAIDVVIPAAARGVAAGGRAPVAEVVTGGAADEGDVHLLVVELRLGGDGELAGKRGGADLVHRLLEFGDGVGGQERRA